MNDRINVRVDPSLKRALEAEARQKGVSPSAIIRQALEEHMRSHPPALNCLELAKRIGVVGVYTDGPHDLSTNPAHMEGFGGD